MAGWKDQDMLNGIAGIMDLAAASGEDLASTSDIVTDALTAFGMQASESGHFADVLAVASSNANTNVGMMGETFKYVAPVAGSLGYTAEDTALAIGLMANSGIKASQAGTSLRSIITRLSTDAGASSKSLGALGVLTQQLGVEFYNTDGTARSLNDVIMDSREAWSGLSEEQQVSYAKTIAGQEAMSAWLALMNAAPGDVEKLTLALEDCDGAAKDMAETMLDNLAGDMKLFESALESLQITVSDALNPTLREFAQFATNAME
ncbi:MAG: phage tail tape measure protein, partial [Acutalibacter sp.]|nr:phage tail tape measure protein [Acutalibacter sp.]